MNSKKSPVRLIVISIIFSCVLLCLFSCGDTENSTQRLKLSLILSENSDWYHGAERFGTLLEERSGGKFEVKIYPHAQLAGQVQRTELEMLQSGVIDLSLESSILLSLIEPRMSVLSMPWLFRDYSQADTILDGPLGQEILDLLPEKGIVGLAFGANGFRQITNSRNAIRTPDDIKGMKVRVPGIKMYIDLFRLLGADPSSMNFGELFTALAQGTMDGQENPLSVIYSSRLHEVQKYLSIWNYSYDPIILCINKRLWDSLSPEIQDIISECAREAMSYERKLVADGESALTDSLRAKGMEISYIDTSALETFTDLAEPVYEKYSEEIGADLINRFREAAKEP